MGADYLVKAHPGATPNEAIENLRAAFYQEGYTDENAWDVGGAIPWPDPFRKGYVQVWAKPVKLAMTDWMRAWITRNPPEGVDPDDKWGPWMTFPLESGGWMFFGWVNA